MMIDNNQFFLKFKFEKIFDMFQFQFFNLF